MPGWLLKSGRENGVCIKDIEKKGSQVPLEFKSSAASGENAPECHGLIQATFWRTMDAAEGLIPDEGKW